MDIGTYKELVIDLFKSGKATEDQWNEMAGAVLWISENDGHEVLAIDRAIGIEETT